MAVKRAKLKSEESKASMGKRLAMGTQTLAYIFLISFCPTSCQLSAYALCARALMN
jgi:hypothetical protein